MKETAIPLKEKLLLDAAAVTIMGTREVCIENYRFLRLLTEQEIQLQTKDCRISITGKKLIVAYYTKEVMKIRGMIECIRYQP